MDSEANKLRAKEYGYMEMWLHALLSVLVLLIWDPIWVYRVTKATNKLDHSQNRTPTGAMLLSPVLLGVLAVYRCQYAGRARRQARRKRRQWSNCSDIRISTAICQCVCDPAPAKPGGPVGNQRTLFCEWPGRVPD